MEGDDKVEGIETDKKVEGVDRDKKVGDVERDEKVEDIERDGLVEDIGRDEQVQDIERDEKFVDTEDASSYSYLDSDDDVDEQSLSGVDEGKHSEAPLTEEEIEELIAELLEVESKAAEAQESLEDELLAKVEVEVREELAQSLSGDDLDEAVADEMATYREEWEDKLDELETESAHLLEQLDGAGIELPSLYKWIESQAINGCCTEAWKKRAHWVGSQATRDMVDTIAGAEKYLQTHRPVIRKHGRIIEEGASGFLGKKLAIGDQSEMVSETSNVEWSSLNKFFSDHSSVEGLSFGSQQWASVYLASTPQQAAELGLRFPGVDEVEEIVDIEDSSGDPFMADAVANERQLFSDEQKRNFRKVKEEDDANADLRLRVRLKQKRRRNKPKKEAIQKDMYSYDMLVESKLDDSVASEVRNGIFSQNLKDDVHEFSDECHKGKLEANGSSAVRCRSLSPDLVESRVSKRALDSNELDGGSKKSGVVTIDRDVEGDAASNKSSSTTFGVGEMVDRDEKFLCTACDKVAAEVHSHPLLKVIICRDCKSRIESKMQQRDSNSSECYCGWCGLNGDLESCGSCKMLFCGVCIKRNLSEEFWVKVQASGWQCCCCSPGLLYTLSSQLEKALQSNCLVVSSSSSDSDYSDADVNVKISSKRRRKKKIRRILDDNELGEETKRKIAIERERQERLKSLGAQFSTKSVMMNSEIFNGKLPDRSSVEMLGDSQGGYVVNVVREEGEEAVRIPPSISTKLKAHQIAGIRFMWENIIQSLTKVKSGDKGLGCILAHTMGLGKTFQVIAFLYAAMRSVDLGLRTTLIVTPVSVLHNWRIEFTKWRPPELKPIRVFMLQDVPREKRFELLEKWRSKGGVFLIGYSAFRNLSLGKHTKDRDMARKITNSLQDGPDILVCDEAHMIKNTRADVTQALKQVKCQRRIALTGSPLQNNLMEYYCMVDFVREGFLGSSHEFRNRFQNPIENGQHTNSTSDDVKIMNQRSHILYEQLKGFVQRMDMNVVKNDLPSKTVFVIAVKLSPLQRKLYRRFLDVHGFTNGKVSGERMQKRAFWAGYQALAQIWNHPGILQLKKEEKDWRKQEDPVENFLADDSSSDDNIDNNMATGEKMKNNNELPQSKTDNGLFKEGWWTDLLLVNNYKNVDYSGKMVLLLDILTMCSDVGDKALVFSQSLSTLDLIELYLSKLPRPGKKAKCWKRGKDWYRLDGRTEGSERQKLVEKFNEPSNKRVRCTLISTRAGSLGINLHAANRVIIVDGSWNPTHDLQAIYRVWRYGQTKPVFAYRLMAHGTMEEKIYKRQVTKEGLAARVVDRQQIYRTISKEEMLHLFDFGDEENLDMIPGLGQENEHTIKQNANVQVGNFLKQKTSPFNGSLSFDKIMESLLGSHHPRWIANYHEHETLLQENEDEKLSKEEQDMAWEVYRRSLQWEEVRVSPNEGDQKGVQVPLDDSAHDRKITGKIPLDESAHEWKPVVSNLCPPVADRGNLILPKGIMRNRSLRKCTNLSHLLTLRSQGIKVGCTTVCGECAQEIRREGP